MLLAPAWRLIILLNHYLLLQLALNPMDFEQKDVSVDHLRLLSHGYEVWEVLELDLRNGVWTEALFVLFEDEF